MRTILLLTDLFPCHEHLIFSIEIENVLWICQFHSTMDSVDIDKTIIGTNFSELYWLLVTHFIPATFFIFNAVW